MRNKRSFTCRTATITILFSVVLCVLWFAGQASAAQGDTLLVSEDSTGIQADHTSYFPSTSSDGRYVAFYSFATNLVAGDTNGATDIFVHDTQDGTTTRVSVDSTGTQAGNNSRRPSISSDGRYVAFESLATNLVAHDTNSSDDIFVHDTQGGTTTRVSVDSTGNQAYNDSGRPSISSDGRYVAFHSIATNLVTGDTNGAADIFIHDTQTGTTTRVSVNSTGNQANDSSYTPSISSDGRYVAFFSDATNLVTGDTNGYQDVFVHDTQVGTTTRVSVDSAGNQAGNVSGGPPSISSDGRYVAFFSNATNLVTGDTNGAADIFVHDTQTGTTTRVSVDSTGNQADDGSYTPSISSDGRYVAFYSYATNLVAGDTNGYRDVFVHDTQTGSTTRVSVDSTGNQADSNSSDPSISSDGRYVAFHSIATNLVAGDTNGSQDVFVHQFLPDPSSGGSGSGGGGGGGSGGCFVDALVMK